MADNIPKNSEWISIQEASELCLYSQEYLSLRARTGKLYAKKIGRNWYTTKKALRDYLAKQTVPAFAKNLLIPTGLLTGLTPEEPEEPDDRPAIIKEFERLNPQIFGPVRSDARALGLFLTV